ncbi:abortive infection family protein [Mangrovihabitans endophyticus]|nr:abortive infection family protein [Mangrovihabitans endophyticus]
MAYELDRPERLGSEQWDAIQEHRATLVNAVEVEDRSAIVGSAKDLIECVARCVLVATKSSIGNRAKFRPVIREAQKSLGRSAGDDISGSIEVRKIAQSVEDIANGVNELRNRVGTGHGRAKPTNVDDEMATVAVDAAMLWCRWALRRLGHILADYPAELLNAIETPVQQMKLQRLFNEVHLLNQPEDIQHRIGVAFGRRAAGGFGNAKIVGIDPVRKSDSISEFSAQYRLGVVEGLIFDASGSICLSKYFVEDVVEIVKPVPNGLLKASVDRLEATARFATWAAGRGSNTVDPAEVVASLRHVSGRLDPKLRAEIERLIDSVSHLEQV